MRRFLDPLFFVWLFIIDVVVWIGTALFGVVPALVIFLAPALLSLAMFGFGRVYANMEPKRFWSFVAGASGVFAVALLITELLTPPFDKYDFTTGAWVLVAAAVGALLGVFLAVAGAIPSPEKADKLAARAAEKRKVEREAQKETREAERQAHRAAKEAERAQAKAEKAAVQAQQEAAAASDQVADVIVEVNTEEQI